MSEATKPVQKPDAGFDIKAAYEALIEAYGEVYRKRRLEIGVTKDANHKREV